MSKQLALAAAFSVFAMAAFALAGPHTVAASQTGLGETLIGATSDLAAPTFSVKLPLVY